MNCYSYVVVDAAAAVVVPVSVSVGDLLARPDIVPAHLMVGVLWLLLWWRVALVIVGRLALRIAAIALRRTGRITS